jgi:bifunctional DNA-binding transcriptional regulator/antitoxin component of YhaV-PrlF toxin-antitoxin module
MGLDIMKDITLEDHEASFPCFTRKLGTSLYITIPKIWSKSLKLKANQKLKVLIQIDKSK